MDPHLIESFRTYIREIDDYRRYLIAATRLAEAPVLKDAGSLQGDLDVLAGALTPGLRKRLHYSSIVVSLYGVVEDFVERLVEATVDYISQSVPSYKDLPGVMRRNHERLSVKLAEQVGHPGYRGHLSLRTVVDNLNRCLSGDNGFRLNREAFSMHTANIRHDVVRDMFTALSLSNIDQAVMNHVLTRELLAQLGRSYGDARFYIDDLADRRNVVAHGERPYNVVSMQTMSEYVRSAQVFGDALYESVLLAVCEFGLPRTATPVGRPTAAYRSGRIVCFRPTVSVDIGLGDRILWRSKESWRIAQVVTLQVNREDRRRLLCAAGSRVGVGLSSSGSSAAEYWVLSGW